MTFVSLCACRMWFVDLAGSERASETKETDRRNRMEGAEINQSLLSVRHNCIYMYSSSQNKSIDTCKKIFCSAY